MGKQDQTLRKLEYKNFDLDNVKATKDGLTVVFYEKGGSSNKHTIVCEGDPHPHFKDALAALGGYYALALELQSGWDYARENLRDEGELLKGAILGAERETTRCLITGVSYLGDIETLGAKIIGSLKCNNNWVKISTPKILFAGTKLGYEQTVMDLCEKVKAETYNYVFNSKRAQLSLDADGGDIAGMPSSGDMFKEEESGK